MKKTLIALAVLAAAGAAHAQTNVTIYGAVDINYTKTENERTVMGERYNNRLGFMGSEDLGGGLKATFQLEQRFSLADGVTNEDGVFSGAANVGFAGASWGQVRFGRLNEVSTETYRQIDPFMQYGVAGMIETTLRGDDGSGRLSSAARYDSPNFSGFKVMGTYSIKGNDLTLPDAVSNAGYGIGATYTNGPIYLVANYNRAKDSAESDNWNIGGAYSFGPARLSAGYERTSILDLDTDNYIIGLSYTIGAGVINASYNNSDTDTFADSASKWAIGYTHNLSKRTSLYANYTNVDDSTGLYNTGISDGYGVEVGVTHKF